MICYLNQKKEGIPAGKWNVVLASCLAFAFSESQGREEETEGYCCREREIAETLTEEGGAEGIVRVESL